MPKPIQRNAGPSPLQSFKQASMITKLVIITVAVYLIDNLFLTGASFPPNESLGTRWLGLDSGLFKSHYNVWQLLTYGFTHAPLKSATGYRHILFNMYGLWLFGRTLEQRYGPREMLFFYLFTIVASALAWTLCQLAFGDNPIGLIGASGGVTAITVLFALSFPHARMQLFFIPISFPVWALGIFLVLNDVRGATMGGDNVAYSVHLAGAVLALVYFATKFSFTGGHFQEQQRARLRERKIALKRELQKPPRHTCTVCSRTNLTDPKLDFRYCSQCDGTPCYCIEHLNEHTHVTSEAQTQ